MFSLFSLLFLACDPVVDDTSEGGVDCTLEFRYSATIAVQDKNGVPLSGEFVTATYTVDGVEGTYIESWEDGSILVGGEESGEFVVNLSAEVPYEDDPCCWDVASTTLEFVIEADECHVISQSFDADLEWGMVCADSEECG